MTPGELIEIGMALWGKDWRKQMADHLGVSRPTVSKWENGKHPVLELAARHLRLLLLVNCHQPELLQQYHIKNISLRKAI